VTDSVADSNSPVIVNT